MPAHADHARVLGKHRVARLAKSAEMAVAQAEGINQQLSRDLSAAYQMMRDMAVEYQRAVDALRASRRAKTLDGARKASEAYLVEIGE